MDKHKLWQTETHQDSDVILQGWREVFPVLVYSATAQVPFSNNSFDRGALM